MYFPGTLNIDLAPFIPQMRNPVFDEVIEWFDGIEERFLLAPIEIEVKGQGYSGLWYYPHPDTKPAHFQESTVVELLLPWIDCIEIGEEVLVRI